MARDQTFPVHLLVAKSARLGGTPGDASLVIPLEPFELQGKTFTTSAIVEQIGFESLELSTLAGRRFKSPGSPEINGIDASIYIQHAHHPLTVRAMAFGNLDADGLPLTIEGRLELDFEGLYDYGAANIVLQSLIRV